MAKKRSKALRLKSNVLGHETRNIHVVLWYGFGRSATTRDSVLLQIILQTLQLVVDMIVILQTLLLGAVQV